MRCWLLRTSLSSWAHRIRLRSSRSSCVNDPLVPSWHEELYRQKVEAAGASEFLVDQIESSLFGHCEFTLEQVLGAFETLVGAVTAEPLALAR